MSSSGIDGKTAGRHTILCLVTGFLLSFFCTLVHDLQMVYSLLHLTWLDRPVDPVETTVHVLLFANQLCWGLSLGGVYVGPYVAGLIGFCMGWLLADFADRKTMRSGSWKIARRIAVLIILCDVIAVCLILLTSDLQKISARLDWLPSLIPALLWTPIALAMLWVSTRDASRIRHPAICHVVAYVVTLLHFGCFLLLIKNAANRWYWHGHEVGDFLDLLETITGVIHLPVSLFANLTVMWIYVPIVGYIVGYVLARFATKDVFRLSRTSLAWWLAVVIVAWECIAATWLLHQFGPRVNIPGWQSIFFLIPLPITLLCLAYAHLWKRVHRSTATPEPAN